MVSLEKIKKLFLKENLTIKNYFVNDGRIIYISVLDNITYNKVFIYIPSRYSIKTDNISITYNLSFIETDNNGIISSDYTDEEKQTEYEEIELNNDLNEENIEKQMEDKYKKEIVLKENGSNFELLKLFRQVKRFKPSVANINYKIAITFQKYLCCISRNDEIELYKTKNKDFENEYRIYVTTDIEYMLNNISKFHLDNKSVNQGVHNILTKNQSSNLKSLIQIIPLFKNCIDNLSSIPNKNKKYKEYINKLLSLSKDLKSKETEIIQKMNLDKQNISHDNIYDDFNYAGSQNGLYSELKKIHSLQNSLSYNMNIVKKNQDDLMLKIDNLCFDNIVMLYTVMENFKKIKEILV